MLRWMLMLSGRRGDLVRRTDASSVAQNDSSAASAADVSGIPQRAGGVACHDSACVFVLCACLWLVAASAAAGPYTEAGVSGYVDRRGRAVNRDEDGAVVNPVFRGWATEVISYLPATGVMPEWADASKALGPATGDSWDIVSLGDLDAGQIGVARPGEITVAFTEPIVERGGYEFAVFENGIVSGYTTGGGSVTGQIYGELAFVEVSSDGVNFVRFAGVSLTPEAVGPYGTIEVSDVYNLAGKHANSGGNCTGTAFDLAELARREEVVSGVVDINDIRYVRIVDIPGGGAYEDMAVEHVDAGTWPAWSRYGDNNAIFDAWLTWGSGGFDLEAVGVLREQEYSADIDMDGVVDGRDFAMLASVWGVRFGQEGWIGRCDLGERDYVVDEKDLVEFAEQWLGVEEWRIED